MNSRETLLRPGYVLLSVLWVIVGVAALGVVVSLSGREVIATTQYRIDRFRAVWRAEECLERARSVIGEILTLPEDADPGQSQRWMDLDRIVPNASALTSADCDVRVEAAGTRLDVNTATAEMLQRLLSTLRIPGARADSLVDALLDWRDTDDDPRANGAERTWYAARGHQLPRNGPLAHYREISRIRGFETMELSGVLDVEPGRIAVNHAPLAVIAALPGMSPTAVAYLEERRFFGRPIADLIDLSSDLPPDARDSLMLRFAELSRVATVEPEAWIITSQAQVGSPPVTAIVDARIVRAGRRAAIVRRRVWIS